MDSVFMIIAILCTIYLIVLTRQNIRKLLETDIQKVGFNWGQLSTNLVEELDHFSASVMYANDVRDLNLQNPENLKCTPNEPTLCKVSDQTSCFGCQNLTARCIHLEHDTNYMDADGNAALLEKNKSIDDGYCLNIGTLADKCNQTHGKWVLVSTNSPREESNYRYTLLCSCTNQGFVGNTSLLGACDTPFVCDGKVVDINQPLGKLECVCGKEYVSVNVNNVPTCQKINVKNAKAEGLPFIPNSIETLNYNTTISGNYPGKELTNPCFRCPVTNEPVFGKVVVDSEGNYQCQASVKYGVPIRRNENFRLLRGDDGPDGVLAIKDYKLNLYGYMDDNTYPTMGITFSVSKNLNLIKALQLPENRDEITLLLEPYHRVKFPYNFQFDAIPNTPDIRLYHGWPHYKNDLINPMNPNKGFEYRTDYKVRLYQSHYLPGSFFTGRESWDICQNQMKPLLVQKHENGAIMFVNNKNLFTLNGETKSLRFGYFEFDFPNNTLTMRTLDTQDAYLKFRDLFVKLGE